MDATYENLSSLDDADFEKERAFAEAFGAHDPDSVRWLDAIRAEQARRTIALEA